MDTRPMDRIMQALLVLTLLPAAAAGGWGVVAIAEDLETRGEMLDGLGVIIGLGFLLLAAVPSGLAGWALRTSLQGKPSAARWAVAAGIAGVVFGSPFGMIFHPLLAVLVVPALLAVIGFERGRMVSTP